MTDAKVARELSRLVKVQEEQRRLLERIERDLAATRAAAEALRLQVVGFAEGRGAVLFVARSLEEAALPGSAARGAPVPGCDVDAEGYCETHDGHWERCGKGAA